MEFNLSENQLKNLLLFLDRVPVKGLVEVSSLNEILVLLTPKQNK